MRGILASASFLVSAVTPIDPLMQLMLKGRTISAERAAAPVEIREARGRVISWLVENDPRSDLLSYSGALAMSANMDDSKNLQAKAALWQKQVDLYREDTAVIMNSVALLQQTDRPVALDLVEHCYQLSKGQNRRIAAYYGAQLGSGHCG